MLKSSQAASPVTQHDFNEEINTRLTFREMFFLAIILFFGFCGFSVCVDKIYHKGQVNQIYQQEDIKHSMSLGNVDLSYQADYSIEH